MPVNWKDPEAFTRLLAAMVAAQDMKLDYRKIASYYGNGATYDSIEGRFRLIKKEAATLRAEIASGARPEAPVRGAGTPTKSNKNGSAATTPRKDRVLGGRVGKNGGGVTPTKRNGGVKMEGGEGSSGGEEVGLSFEGWEDMGGVGMGMGMVGDPFEGLEGGV